MRIAALIFFLITSSGCVTMSVSLVPNPAKNGQLRPEISISWNNGQNSITIDQHQYKPPTFSK